VSLNLYRRHIKACTKGYSQNERVHRPSTKGERTKDCGCPISAEGPLREGSIQNVSTRKTTWEDAERVVAQWEQWGRPSAPEPVHVIPTVEDAVASFLAVKRVAVESSTVRAFEVLLNKRLVEYANNHNHVRISDFSCLHTTTEFIGSWVNLSKPGPLMDTSRKAEVERLRAFYRFCVARKWMTENPAMSKDLAVKTKVTKKFGMELDEERRVFEAIMKFKDQHGEAGQDNAEELYCFCSVMRVAGLRISDATTLNNLQVIPRMGGNGWAIQLLQKKTDEYVYIPITLDLYERLNRLPFKGEKSGRKYWFWSGIGSVKTAKNNWYRKITKVLDGVAKERAFVHDVTPHTFRHTFSIRHLNAGVNLKFVSRWLGHQSTAITEKHYSHAVLETMIASDAAFEQSLQSQCSA